MWPTLQNEFDIPPLDEREYLQEYLKEKREGWSGKGVSRGGRGSFAILDRGES